MLIGPQGGSCGTAVYRRQAVYTSDILEDPIWDHYRHRLLPFGIRAVWSRPLFTSEGQTLGTFAIHYREVRSPDDADLKWIENASHIAGIAIDRHRNEEQLRLERDPLRLLLEVTNSIASKLDIRRLVETLSTDLLRVTRCDFCALLLPDPDSGELRVTTLYNPEPRGSLCDGTIIPIHGSICARPSVPGRLNTLTALRKYATTPKVSATPWVNISINESWMKAWCRGAICHLLAEAAW